MRGVDLVKIDARVGESGLEREVQVDGKSVRVRLHYTVNGMDEMYAFAVRQDGRLLQTPYGNGGRVDSLSWEKGVNEAINNLVAQFRQSGVPKELLTQAN